MNKLYCLIGPSGSGKDTIKYASGLPYVVSYRTREKRPGEVEGKDGYFITEEEFFAMDEEWVAHTEYAGNFYGVTRAELALLKYSPMIYVIDWKGFVRLQGKLRSMGIDAEPVSIFIDVDPEEIEERMKKGGRHPDEIKKRMIQLKEDVKVKDKCDHIIHNDTTVEDAVEQLHQIIKLVEEQ